MPRNLGCLNFLHLFLLQNQHDLSQSHCSEEGQQTVDPYGILENHFGINLAKTAHVWVVGQGCTSFNVVANVDEQGRADGHRFSAAVTINGVDGDQLGAVFAVLNCANSAAGGSCVSGVVALLTCGIHLATAAVATDVNLIFAEVDAAVCGRSGERTGKTISWC